MRLLKVAILAAAIFLLPSARAQVSSNAAPTLITRAAAILDLSPEAAENHPPVSVAGIVTCSDSAASLLFVQDSSAGIYVYTTVALPPIGTKVEVKGTTSKGRFSPIIMADSIQAVGMDELPKPKPISVEQMGTGRLDSQWIEVEGVVLREWEHWGHLVLTIGSGGSRVDVRILQADKAHPPNWVDARVTVRGVAGTTYNDRGQFTGFHLLTQNESLVTVLERAPADPFAAELRSSRKMLAYSRKGASEHRMRLRGTVTFYWPGRDFYIQDAGGGVRVHSRETIPLKPGDVVEVVGFPEPGAVRPALQEAIYRKVAEGAEIPARRIWAKDALKGEAEGEVATMEGKVLQTDEAHVGFFALVLEADQKVFRVCYPADWKAIENQMIGGTVRVTGVCVLDENTSQKSADTFSIWMRQPKDLAILERPAAWRQKQMVYGLATLGGAVALGAVWVALLRLRVRRQTEKIRSRERALEERYRELFENSNDIIYAHDLDGKITSMNNAGQALLGYTLGELTRMSIADLVDADDLEKARTQTHAKLKGSPRTAYELRLRSKSGQLLTLEINSRLSFRDGVACAVQGIARDITARKKAEDALRVSERQLRASLEERERLGRDLHDGIIQSIYAAGLNIDDCARIVVKEPEAVEKRLRKVMGDLNGVIKEVRDFIVGLERHRLKGSEFTGALKSLALTLGDSKPCRIDLEVDETAAAALSAEEATQLIHIAREALSNSVRHAHAQRVQFRLQRVDGTIRFEISDDGVGFNPAVCETRGFGLRNMAARAREMGAAFHLYSQTGEGARIVLDMSRQTSEQSPRENPAAYR